MKTTKKDVQNAFERFTKAYNLKTNAEVVKDQPGSNGKYYSNDFIRLDFNSYYGGYRLDVVETSTGERFFDGMGRMSAKEMLAYLNGLLTAKKSYPFENIVNDKN